MKLDYVICTRYFHRGDLFNVDVIVRDCLTSWAFRCMKISWLLVVVSTMYFEQMHISTLRYCVRQSTPKAEKRTEKLENCKSKRCYGQID